MATDVEKLIERSFVAFNEADWDAMEPLYWPDAEAKAPEGWPEAEDMKGWPAVRRQFERLKDSWAEDDFELLSSDEVSEGCVLVHGVWHTRGKGSGIEADLDSWVVGYARDGRFTRLEFYLDEAEARGAVSQP